MQKKPRTVLRILGIPLMLAMAVLATLGLRQVQAQQEREIDLNQLQDRPVPLKRFEIAGTRITGFVEGSFTWNSALRLPAEELLPDIRVPELAAPADPGSTNFRFDKFTIGATKRFASWLLVAGAIEVENERALEAVEEEDGRFELEIEEGIEIGLDFFEVTGIVPLGNGLALSLGKFDVPFGIEREDAPFNLQATRSLVFELGRPSKVVGFRARYQFFPALDVSVFIVNGWDVDNDNNDGKTVGGRLGVTPWPGVNLGLGGFYGPEQNDRDGPQRGIIDVDATLSVLPRLLLAAEFVYGMEESVRLVREDEEVEVRDATWLGLSVTARSSLWSLF